jgi:hypothetical protein
MFQAIRQQARDSIGCHNTADESQVDSDDGLIGKFFGPLHRGNCSIYIA